MRTHTVSPSLANSQYSDLVPTTHIVERDPTLSSAIAKMGDKTN